MSEKAFNILFVCWGLFCLTMLGVGIFVAAHFIGKFW